MSATFNDIVAEAQALESEYRSGKISQGEYQELLEDLHHTHVISNAALDLQTKTELNGLLNNLATASGFII
jgi:hypothetical protein